MNEYKNVEKLLNDFKTLKPDLVKSQGIPL